MYCEPVKTRMELVREMKSLENRMNDIDKELMGINPDPVKEVAHAIHRAVCHKRHDDDCSFYYDTWDNPSGERQKFVKQAVAMLKIVDKSVVLNILDILEI